MNRIKEWWKWVVIGGLFISVATVVFMNEEESDITELKISMFAGSQWGVPNGNCYDIMDETIEEFEREHPGVNVTYESGILLDDYSEWLSEKILEGDIPDVFMVLPQDFNMLVSIGTMMDLDRIIKKDKGFSKDKYYESALKEGEYQGKQYALPFESVPTLMFVNQTLLSEEGIEIPNNNWTWDEFYRICKKVTKDKNGDGELDQFGVYNYTWKNALYSNGETLFDESGSKCNIASSKARDAIEFTRKLNQISRYQKAETDDFDMGHVAFYPMSFAEYRTYNPYPWKINKFFKFNWECIKLPAGPSGGNVSRIESSLFGISSKSRHKELAWEFLKKLTYEEQTQYKIFEKSQGISVLRSVTNSDKTEEALKIDSPNTDLLNKGLLNELMSQAIVEEKFRQYDYALRYIDSSIPALLEDDADIEGGLLKLKNEVNQLLLD